jgi:hypothetical protein
VSLLFQMVSGIPPAAKALSEGLHETGERVNEILVIYGAAVPDDVKTVAMTLKSSLVERSRPDALASQDIEPADLQDLDHTIRGLEMALHRPLKPSPPLTQFASGRTKTAPVPASRVRPATPQTRRISRRGIGRSRAWNKGETCLDGVSRHGTAGLAAAASIN